ncbi:hypothetical protein SD37_22085 [Amycolatopsis orientalis]|uniref:Secreted protein n=1 Tax=Amycolatopsis orientalis TaxID=31958 RepID=A0A193C0S1_AMYOR|nr:hypothetical protein [Amycolatopsis orientalis]ANN18072.1 hypothetical protein SD37_22085 [Amycolatopsis orientalis]
MSRRAGAHRVSRRTKIATGALGLAIAAGALVVSTAAGNSDSAGAAQAGSRIVCPDVASRLPAIPARAKAEVDRNLAQLGTQITEAEQRLASSVGQGGPNFVQNAILGPLADKRTAAIERIAISIGRAAAKPQGLADLAPCSLGTSGAPSVAPSSAPSAAPSSSAGGVTGARRIVCPDVASRLPEIPARAQAEVDRNLAQLRTQIAEAEQRLVSSAGQGGPNFVQNAILGPLADKRTAAIERIAISIGRAAAKPQGLGALAPCSAR